MTDRLDHQALLAKPLPLPPRGMPESAHVFEPDSLLALDTALICKRPLLLRGEPGTGKSQLARAAAVALGRVFVSTFVSARTQAHDLMWSYDAVARLAKAQMPKADEQSLAPENFIRPGPLWWALNWRTATIQAERAKATPPDEADTKDASRGVVLLIDEIDKADSSVPNGLLECLGQGTFRVEGTGALVEREGTPPLVIFTTNEERALPDAFVRRCVVLHLRVPDPREWPGLRSDALTRWLVERGEAHFARHKSPALTKLLEQAALRLASEREAVRSEGHCPPGLAEYIDLVEALLDGGRGLARASEQLAAIAPFVLRKHVDPGPRTES